MPGSKEVSVSELSARTLACCCPEGPADGVLVEGCVPANGKFPAEDTLEDPCEGTVCTAIFPAVVTTGGSGVNPESSRAEQFATLLCETTGGAKFTFC